MDEKKEWLQKWQDVMTRDYDGVEHDIDPKGLDRAKLGEGGNVMTDGCNGARKFNRLMVETINKLYKERGSLGANVTEESIGSVIVQSIADTAVQSQNDEEDMDNPAAGDEEEHSDGSNNDDDNLSVLSDASDSTTVSSSDPAVAMESYCHHHIRNVWWGGLIKETTRILRDALASSLDDINARLCITPNMKNILRLLDKCFSLPANNPKGNGVEFKHYAKRFHPGVPLYPVQRTTGSKNDMVLEGAVAAYINGWLYKLFLDEALSTPDAANILQENFFIILSSVEMIALSHLFAILHFSINVPMRWLAGKTHTLVDHDWSMKKWVPLLTASMMHVLNLSRMVQKL